MERKVLTSGFNKAYNNIASSYLKVGNDSTGAIIFLTTAKGNLPHLSYILCKPKPLGKQFNTTACYITGAFIFVDIESGKEYTKKIKCHLELEAMQACTKRAMESTKGLGQRDVKGNTRDFFGSWVSSKRLAEAAMNVGSYMFVMVKTN